MFVQRTWSPAVRRAFPQAADTVYSVVSVWISTPTGHGLIGMRERAGIYGGTVTSGPGPQGGFEVSLTIPVVRAR